VEKLGHKLGNILGIDTSGKTLGKNIQDTLRLRYGSLDLVTRTKRKTFSGPYPNIFIFTSHFYQQQQQQKMKTHFFTHQLDKLASLGSIASWTTEKSLDSLIGGSEVAATLVI
jgi:hypothetical protein